jgi:RNA polymerase sigma-70 factor (ECF subfamily)
LVKENYLGAVDRTRGKFRSFLLAAFNHFLANQRDYERAAKRGGGQTVVSPERIFERNWFLALFDHALARLREEQTKATRADVFEQVEAVYHRGRGPGRLQRSGSPLQMTPNAVAVAVHRWRERYKKLVQEEVVRTVADPAEIEDELRRFFAVMAP